jgi:hypothetical protein
LDESVEVMEFQAMEAYSNLGCTRVKIIITTTTLFHTATNLYKSLQSDTREIKTTIARNLKERWEAKRLD